MFLGAYHFDGERTELVAAYERFMQHYPPGSIDLHACVLRDAGITIYDACPSREVFERFAAGREFRDLLAACGLPSPRVEPVGEVHAAHVRDGALR